MKLYNGDCLETMDLLIEQGVKVDAIITDPPYGTTACKWDSVIPFDAMWERLNKLIKPNGAIVLFGSEPFSSALRMSNIKNYKYDWIWDKKKSAGAFNSKYQPLKVHENIHIFGLMASTYSKKGSMFYSPQMKKTSREVKEVVSGASVADHSEAYIRKYDNKGLKYPKSIIAEIKTTTTRQHPTQKPVALMEYLIKTYTNEGETVLDFTMGSGSTGAACKKLERDFIGIELDKGYYDIAVNRIKETKPDLVKL